MKPKVDLQIEALILRDLPYAMRRPIAAAVERELARLLDERGLPPQWAAGGMVPSVSLSGLRFPDGAKPGLIGTTIAQQVYGQLAGGASPAGAQPPQEVKG